MKKHLIPFVAICISLSLMSWGITGHRAIALIAENHLAPEAKSAVSVLLGGKSMADVSNEADEQSKESQNSYRIPWHYINVPLGLDYNAFNEYVFHDTKPNIYTNLLIDVGYLRNPGTLKVGEGKRILAEEHCLKWIIHLVGDAHQPMNVSGEADKNGSAVHVKFDEKHTNLHDLWDTKLIEKEALSDKQLAKTCDTASNEQITRWQLDAPIQWLWESYQISTRLYEESKPGGKLDDNYYQSHIAITNERIEKAGIRLAGLLNQIFAYRVSAVKDKRNYPPPVVLAGTGVPGVELNEVAKHIGEHINVTGTVEGYKEIGDTLLIYMGGAYPNNTLTVVFKGDGKEIGEMVKAEGTSINVIGTLIYINGKTEIEVTTKKQLFVPEK